MAALTAATTHGGPRTRRGVARLLYNIETPIRNWRGHEQGQARLGHWASWFSDSRPGTRLSSGGSSGRVERARCVMMGDVRVASRMPWTTAPTRADVDGAVAGTSGAARGHWCVAHRA